MKVETLTQMLNILVDQKFFGLAYKIASANPQCHYNIPFNDVYATILYFLEKYSEALIVLDLNIQLLSKYDTTNNWFAATYFQKANCYLALNNFNKAKYYYQKSIHNEPFYSPLYNEIQNIVKKSS